MIYKQYSNEKIPKYFRIIQVFNTAIVSKRCCPEFSRRFFYKGFDVALPDKFLPLQLTSTFTFTSTFPTQS